MIQHPNLSNHDKATLFVITLIFPTGDYSGSSSKYGGYSGSGSLDRSYSSSSVSRPQRSSSAVGHTSADRYSLSSSKGGYGSDYGGSTISVSSSYGAGGTAAGYSGSRLVLLTRSLPIKSP